MDNHVVLLYHSRTQRPPAPVHDCLVPASVFDPPVTDRLLPIYHEGGKRGASLLPPSILRRFDGISF